MPRHRLGIALAAVLCLPVAASSAQTKDRDAGARLAAHALEACKEGRNAQDRETRRAHFERGQQLGEQAVAADDNSADTHFSLFCNMGELMRLDGESISSVLALRKLLAELDRTLELNPTHTDALAAKGTFLVRLPRILGGDVEKGEALLRQVIQQDPNALSSRLTLARTCGQRGDHEEAIAFATRALQIARVQGRADKVAEAQTVLAELRAGR